MRIRKYEPGHANSAISFHESQINAWLKYSNKVGKWGFPMTRNSCENILDSYMSDYFFRLTPFNFRECQQGLIIMWIIAVLPVQRVFLYCAQFRYDRSIVCSSSSFHLLLSHYLLFLYSLLSLFCLLTYMHIWCVYVHRIRVGVYKYILKCFSLYMYLCAQM